MIQLLMTRRRPSSPPLTLTLVWLTATAVLALNGSAVDPRPPSSEAMMMPYGPWPLPLVPPTVQYRIDAETGWLHSTLHRPATTSSSDSHHVTMNRIDFPVGPIAMLPTRWPGALPYPPEAAVYTPQCAPHLMAMQLPCYEMMPYPPLPSQAMRPPFAWSLPSTGTGYYPVQSFSNVLLLSATTSNVLAATNTIPLKPVDDCPPAALSEADVLSATDADDNVRGPGPVDVWIADQARRRPVSAPPVLDAEKVTPPSVGKVETALPEGAVEPSGADADDDREPRVAPAPVVQSISSIDMMETFLNHQLQQFCDAEGALSGRVRAILSDVLPGRASSASRDFGRLKGQIMAKADAVIRASLPDLVRVDLDHVLGSVQALDVSAVDPVLVQARLWSFVDELRDAVSGRFRQIQNAVGTMLKARPARIRSPLTDVVRAVVQQLSPDVHARLDEFRRYFAERLGLSGDDSGCSDDPQHEGDSPKGVDPLVPDADVSPTLMPATDPVESRASELEDVGPLAALSLHPVTVSETPAIASDGDSSGLPMANARSRRNRRKHQKKAVIGAVSSPGDGPPTELAPSASSAAPVASESLETGAAEFAAEIDIVVQKATTRWITSDAVIAKLMPSMGQDELPGDAVADPGLSSNLESMRHEHVTLAVTLASDAAQPQLQVYRRRFRALIAIRAAVLTDAVVAKPNLIPFFMRCIVLLDLFRSIWVRVVVVDAVHQYLALAEADCARDAGQRHGRLATRLGQLPGALTQIVDLGRDAFGESLRDLLDAVPTRTMRVLATPLLTFLAQHWSTVSNAELVERMVDSSGLCVPAVVPDLEQDAPRPPLADADLQLIAELTRCAEAVDDTADLPPEIRFDFGHGGVIDSVVRVMTPLRLSRSEIRAVMQTQVNILAEQAAGVVQRTVHQYHAHLVDVLIPPFQKHVRAKFDGVADNDDDDALLSCLAQIMDLASDLADLYERLMERQAARYSQTLLSDRLLHQYQGILARAVPKAPNLRTRDVRAMVRDWLGDLAKFKGRLLDQYGNRRLLRHAVVSALDLVAVPAHVTVWLAARITGMDAFEDGH